MNKRELMAKLQPTRIKKRQFCYGCGEYEDMEIRKSDKLFCTTITCTSCGIVHTYWVPKKDRIKKEGPHDN